MSQESTSQLDVYQKGLDAANVNVENINRLISHLKSLESPLKFKMSTYSTYISIDKAIEAGLANRGKHFAGLYHECNTACCIAGWANFLQLNEDCGIPLAEINLDDLANADHAAEWLGITEPQARELFTGHWSANIPQAVRCLEILRDEKHVSWSIAIYGPVSYESVPHQATEPTND